MPLNALYAIPQTRPFLFEIEDFYNGAKLNLEDEVRFPGKKKSLIQKTISFPEFGNPHIENEIRGTIQHFIRDIQRSVNGVPGYFTMMRSIGEFLFNCHPDCESIVDFDLESILDEYKAYLSNRGVKTRTDRKFAQTTESMEWVVHEIDTDYITRFVQYYKYIYSITYPDNRNEYDKDIWDIRNLGIPFDTSASRPRYTINYENIVQPWLRKNAKEYNYFRIQNKTMSAVIDDMKMLNLFSRFLEEKHPEIKSLREMERSVAEDYIGYVHAQNFVTTTINRRISALRTFLRIGNMLCLDDFPTKPLFFNSDYEKVEHKLPKFFSDYELRQMNNHISDLPLQVGRIFFVAENCGQRISDLCESQICYDGKPCLKKNNDGSFIFTYKQPKVHRTNSIPVSELVGVIIEEAIQTSKEQFGPDCKYIFATSKTTPISTCTFNRQMNNMSKRNDLRTDAGKPLRIKGHTFRGTVATRYANCGISMDVIRMMLGQRKIGVLKHYVTIHSTTMVEAMRNIMEENDRMIRNIGHIEDAFQEEMTEPSLIPLPNGACAKSVTSGICDHANACYDCRMFRASKCHLPLYEMQLQEARNNIEIAKLHGYTRILEQNQKLEKNLVRIITQLEGS